MRNCHDADTVPAISDLEKKNAAVARRAAAEGMVLLENKNGILPLSRGAVIALYGGGALYTIKGGTGSGAVNNRYNVSIAQGLRDAGIKLSNEDWLADYEIRYETARAAWMQEIYDKSEPGQFHSLYRAHATTPLAMPRGMQIEAAKETDTAVYVISRVSGEGADRKEIPGDYYLSEVEEEELAGIRKNYRRIIVILNTGGIIDLSFADRYEVDALVLMSQAGQEGGHALADLLTGAVTPSGRLTDTWAYRYADYPSSSTFSHNNGNIIEEKYTDGLYVGYRYFDSFGVQPRYRFGYGLSYTTFETKTGVFRRAGSGLVAAANVRNTGTCSGREVVFVYACCPGEVRHKPVYTLIGFGKTPLIAPNEEASIEIPCSLEMLEEYHAGMSRWQLEAGDYYILAGSEADPADMRPLCILRQNSLLVTKEVSPVCPLLDALSEIRPDHDAAMKLREKTASRFDEECPVYDLKDLLGDTLSPAEDTVFPAASAASGEEDLDSQDSEAARIVSLLTTEQKALLCCGRLKDGPAEFIGNASVTVPGAAGETTAVLKDEFGVPNAALADGPAGLRLWQMYETDPKDGHVLSMTPYQGLENRIFGRTFPHEGADRHYQFCTAFPIGMLLAQSFDCGLLEEVGKAVGEEMEAFHVSLWLAPGMNIHRNPLCGRNYEYYSEDPLVSGKIAAAITRGVQTDPRLGTTIKHYACNNQEENRMGVSSIVSERTLRELYLKGFEIAVRESQPKAIMTSYNKVNGVHTANSYDLCTKIAREEWEFEGIIMTDWTTTNRGNGSSAAKCVAAGNDLTMPGSHSDVHEIIDAVRRTGEQFLEEDALNACAKRLVRYLLSTK